MRPNQAMQETSRHITAEEFETLPGHDHHYELVKGQLVPRMSPVGLRHGEAVSQIVYLLKHHVRQGRLGLVVPELGVKLASNPDTVRGPDVAFVRSDRIPTPPSRGFFTGPPDLAVELLSPDDRHRKVQGKVRGLSGTRHARRAGGRSGQEHRHDLPPLAPPVTFDRDDDVIDLDEAVPRFRCTVREIFE